MKKIVYVMHIEWNWIKQRPQFVAEELAKEYTLTVVYQHRYLRKGFQKRNPGDIGLKPIYVIPRGDRYPLLRCVNNKIKAAAIRNHVKKINPDVLYVTFPDQVSGIESDFTGKVIYDCMDNHPAFCATAADREKIEQQEAALMQRADTVLVSSCKLKEMLLDRYGVEHEGKITLVRNGYNGQLLETDQTVPAASERYTLAYFGTISSWFNFDYVLKSLEDFPQLEYLLIGPADTQIPQHERIRYIGTVEHKELPVVTKDAQCLIMPFVLNEIIEAVDPVKLYEYINFNKNILCVEYPEVKRFAPFVHFYTDYASYLEQLKQLMGRTDVKYTPEQRKAFLEQNSWPERVNIIRELL